MPHLYSIPSGHLHHPEQQNTRPNLDGGRAVHWFEIDGQGPLVGRVTYSIAPTGVEVNTSLRPTQNRPRQVGAVGLVAPNVLGRRRG